MILLVNSNYKLKKNSKSVNFGNNKLKSNKQKKRFLLKKNNEKLIKIVAYCSLTYKIKKNNQNPSSLLKSKLEAFNFRY
jgi:hypothetical protein